MSSLPSQAEVIDYFERLSNWGRWGTEDSLGTLNLITPEKRRAAAALVRDGATISCAHDIESRAQASQPGGPPQRFMLGTGDAYRGASAEGDRSWVATEYLGLAYHGNTTTHIDSPAHLFWDGKLYNGRPATDVTARTGAGSGAVTDLRDGVYTRGVLLDVAAAQGRDWLDESEPVLPEHLEQAEAAAGTRVESGDAVLLRTGFWQRRLTEDDGEQIWARLQFPGWHASCLPWLHERGVALIGSDVTQDVRPSGYEALRLPVHTIGLVAMGLWLVDVCNLEDLAAECQRRERWDFQFIVAPLRWEGATGSPVNPIAVF